MGKSGFAMLRLLVLNPVGLLIKTDSKVNFKKIKKNKIKNH